MTVGSLFSGIEGFGIGLEWAGMLMGEPVEILWQVEIDPWCRKKLAEQWPNAERFDDVKKVGKKNLKPVDLLHGSPPCQSFSVAGKRAGKEDDRYLWPEMSRIIAEIQPRYGSLLKMFLESSIWHSMMCFLTWKIKATPAGRLIFQLAASAPCTEESGSGLWPTATTPRPHDNDNTAGKYYLSQNQKDLTWATKMFPSPHANCATGAGNTATAGRICKRRWKMCPTPSARDHKGANSLKHIEDRVEDSHAHLGQLPNAIAREMKEAIGGSLNPDWVEMLMGFPVGWTSVKSRPLEWNSTLGSLRDFMLENKKTAPED